MELSTRDQQCGEITGTRLPTISRILRHRASLSPERVALRSTAGASWTFPELERGALAIAARLRMDSAGRRFAIVMRNGPFLTLAILAASMAGTAMPLHHAHRRDEFHAYLQRLGADVLVVDESHPDAEAAARDLAVPVVRLGDGRRGDPGAVSIAPEADDIALILMTSGSTGKPKLVPLSHRNLCVSAAEVAESVGLSEEDVCLSMWELHHIGGLVDLLLAPILSGGSIVSTSGFDAAEFFGLLRDAKPTWFQAVPTTLHEIVAMAKRNRLDVRGHSLRFLRSVAARLPEDLREEVEVLFGVPVIETFGMTEAGPLITSTRLPPAVRKPGSVGPTCGTEIRILGPGGDDLPAGETGEVAIRGDNVFAGYEDEPAENHARFRDGWFLTGDLGRLDHEGHLFLAGRTKQLINRGGEKINPLEVEEVLLSHEAVADAAAFAVEHRTLGEDVAAAVVLHPGHECTGARLRAHAGEHLVAFKVPQRILFLDALPLTGVGKIDRPELARIAGETNPAEAAVPSDEVERELATIWAREMNLDSIGPEENFFAAGGDSLMGMRLLVAVEQWLGATLPVSLMSGISTVREMASQLKAEGLEKTAAPVETVSPVIREIRMVMTVGRVPVVKDCPTLKARRAHSDTGAAPPLYWCFNSPDWEMSRLVRAWSGPTSVIGLYSGGDGGDESIEAVADHYCEVIRQRRNGRPYFLGGNCRGARVVERMLGKLREAGAPPLGVMIMEHASETAAAMDFPVLFLFGESSLVSKKDQKPFRKMANTHGGNVRVATMQGRHGRFFRRENIASLEAGIRNFIESIPSP